jgi:hypothetical protein
MFREARVEGGLVYDDGERTQGKKSSTVAIGGSTRNLRSSTVSTIVELLQA